MSSIVENYISIASTTRSSVATTTHEELKLTYDGVAVVSTGLHSSTVQGSSHLIGDCLYAPKGVILNNSNDRTETVVIYSASLQKSNQPEDGTPPREAADSELLGSLRIKLAGKSPDSTVSIVRDREVMLSGITIEVVAPEPFTSLRRFTSVNEKDDKAIMALDIVGKAGMPLGYLIEAPGKLTVLYPYGYQTEFLERIVNTMQYTLKRLISTDTLYYKNPATNLVHRRA